MEALPFAENSFDAAVSQFGVEYGNIADTARELERVLKPGARLRFLVHHRDGEIVEQGRMRYKALQAVISGRPKKAFLSGNINELSQETQRVMKQYPNEPTLELISDYYQRKIATTSLGRQTLWQNMAESFSPEIWMLRRMEQSSMSSDDLGRWLVPLLSRMFLVGASTVRRQIRRPVAWSIHGVR